MAAYQITEDLYDHYESLAEKNELLRKSLRIVVNADHAASWR